MADFSLFVRPHCGIVVNAQFVKSFDLPSILLQDAVLVKDIWADGNLSSPTNLLNVGGVMYFQANDGINGRELRHQINTISSFQGTQGFTLNI